MGAKSAIIMFADKPPREYLRNDLTCDTSAATALASEVFADAELTPVGTSSLDVEARPDSGLVYAGRFPGVDIVTCREFMLDYPPELPDKLLRLAEGRAMYVHCMHSVVDWFAFGEYRNGRWIRSLSLSPDSGILVDVGDRLACEAPYWAGEQPVDDEYALPFHPLELAEDVMCELFGFTLEGVMTDLDADTIRLHGFQLV